MLKANERINKLIKFLKLKPQIDPEGQEYYDTTDGSIYGDNLLREAIRRVLGLDKQCSQCSNWFYEMELSLIEGTQSLICEKCTEGILSGKFKIKETE